MAKSITAHTRKVIKYLYEFHISAARRRFFSETANADPSAAVRSVV